VAEVEFDELPSFEVTKNVVNLVPYGASTYKSKFTPWAWSEVSQGSGVYAMPGDAGPMAFYYNTKELAKYGITPPTTWAEFATDAAKLHKANPNAYMTNFSAIDLQWVMSLMAQDNAWPFAYSGGSNVTINWTGPKQMAFASYWQNLLSTPGTGTVGGRRRRSAWIQRRDRRGIWFVVPFLVGFVLFMIVPLVYAIYTSLYTTKIIGGTVFSGASNYTQTLQSSQVWSGVVRVIIYAAIQIPVMLAIAFFFGCVFDLGVAKFGRTFRTIFFIPFAVPAVVGAVMWSFLLEPQFGPMVHLANEFGFAGTNFFSPSLILPSIIVIVIWEWTGYNMVILYTALKSVPRDVVEAAILDDTPLWRIILRIKLPLVRPAIVLLVFLNTIGALQLFTEPLILSYFETGSVSVNYTPTLYLFRAWMPGPADLALFALLVCPWPWPSSCSPDAIPAADVLPSRPVLLGAPEVPGARAGPVRTRQTPRPRVL
jgi:multiple sugar transport system permease protein